MTSQVNMAVWRDCIRAWYPEYETKTYFVPSVVITRIPFDEVTVAGQSVLVPKCNPDQAYSCPAISTQPKEVKVQHVRDSDTREDLALQRVLDCLQVLLKHQSERMFVISRLQFSSYLGEPCYAAAVKQFLRPHNLTKENRRGHFDILIIHRDYGIITGEIKSVLSSQDKIPQSDVDGVVTERVRNAIKQLNKSEVVLREITKDLEPDLAIRKFLILPYVTADILKRAVSSDEQLNQDLITCLQTAELQQAIDCCLLAETVSSNGNEKVKWWSTFSSFKSKDKMMTNDLYLDLLARFCGPATTISICCPMSPRIQIRTEGQGVAIAGERMTSLVLTPEQVNLLATDKTRVLLTGPPGVGKSVMLVLIALTWLRRGQGHDIHLVSVDTGSLAATRMINHTIQMSMRDDFTTPSVEYRVHTHEYDFYKEETDVDKAIKSLIARRESHGPYIICDEFWFEDRHTARYHRFITNLCTLLPSVYLWAASQFHNQRPEELSEEQMTIPLRCPPAVLNEVEMGVKSYRNEVHPYMTNALAKPCGGPYNIYVHHQGPLHAGFWPLECVKCGQAIAGILQRLRLCVMDSSINGYNSTETATTVPSHSITADASKTSACPRFQYRDVFVLTRSFDLRDGEGLTSLANGVVRGLRDAGIPVRVIRTGHEATDVLDTAVGQSDVVTVAHYGEVYGLERKVVVFLPGRIPGRDDDLTDEDIQARGRLYAMSRCTALLVVVNVPRA